MVEVHTLNLTIQLTEILPEALCIPDRNGEKSGLFLQEQW